MLALAVVGAGCSSDSRRADPPVLVPPCSCWTKVGLGAQSLPVNFKNFLKQWFFIDVRHGRVSSFYFASKFVD